MRARVWLAVVVALTVLFGVAAASSWSLPSRTHGYRSSPAASTTQPKLPRGHRAGTTGAIVVPAGGIGTPQTRPPVEPGPWRPTPVLRDRLLVAYYGTAGTGSLGVLGSGSIPEVTRRLRAVAARYAAATSRKVQIVYELIATVADGDPGPDGSYSHDIPRADVERYLAAARRNHALLVLDLQPGRSDFLTVAKRYAWALRQPDVGIALDPEWRMGPGQVPGQVFGSVSAEEVNETAAYVAGITRRCRLPEKLFVIHQFVPQSVPDIEDVRPRKGLALVQHVDGWGDRADKMATYHAVARPRQFAIGFKLFYREDPDMFTPRELLRAVPRVRFVSYQ